MIALCSSHSIIVHSICYGAGMILVVLLDKVATDSGMIVLLDKVATDSYRYDTLLVPRERGERASAVDSPQTSTCVSYTTASSKSGSTL